MKSLEMVVKNMAIESIATAISSGVGITQEFVKIANGTCWMLHCRSFFKDGVLKLSQQFTTIVDEHKVQFEYFENANFSYKKIEDGLQSFLDTNAELSEVPPTATLVGDESSFIRTTKLKLKPELIEPLKDEAELLLKKKNQISSYLIN